MLSVVAYFVNIQQLLLLDGFVMQTMPGVVAAADRNMEGVPLSSRTTYSVLNVTDVEQRNTWLIGG